MANDKFIAVSKSAGGGPVYILRNDQPGRVNMNTPTLSVQKGKAWDHDFHPFISNMIATVSDDCSVAVTQFPAEGLTENITKADVLMQGHGKKVVLCQFNPSANSLLATASYDRTVKLWNIESGDNIMTFKEPGDNIYSLEWNHDGSQLAVTGKDKQLRLFDPRIPDEATSVQAFEGSKSSKAFWIPNLNWVGACGFSKTARRQMKFWDLKEDIYPDCYAGKPALSADEWLDGNNKDPIYTSMDPEKKENGDEQEIKFEKKKTYQELEQE